VKLGGGRLYGNDGRPFFYRTGCVRGWGFLIEGKGASRAYGKSILITKGRERGYSLCVWGLGSSTSKGDVKAGGKRGEGRCLATGRETELIASGDFGLYYQSAWRGGGYRKRELREQLLQLERFGRKSSDSVFI